MFLAGTIVVNKAYFGQKVLAMELLSLRHRWQVLLSRPQSVSICRCITGTMAKVVDIAVAFSARVKCIIAHAVGCAGCYNKEDQVLLKLLSGMFLAVVPCGLVPQPP